MLLCDICKKNEATVHLTEIINDEMTELHLCEECAKTKGEEMEQHFSIADLLAGMVEFPVEIAKRKEHVRIKCLNCGMGYVDFKKLGRFGCAQCYEAFKRALYPLFKKIHGSTCHIGKQPEAIGAKRVEFVKPEAKVKPRITELEELKSHLAKAIEHEEFEEAAVLRDKIRVLEAKEKTKG